MSMALVALIVAVVALLLSLLMHQWCVGYIQKLGLSAGEKIEGHEQRLNKLEGKS